MTKTTVIIAFYKRLDFLKLILEGLQQQTIKDFEVVIAEDNDAPETKNFIEINKNNYSFPLFHVCQEDNGFRKNKILNAAVKKASTEKLIFLDGDCIPHPKLVYSYSQLIQKGRFYYARRVMLSEKFTQNIIEKAQLSFNFFELMYHKCKKLRDALYLPFVLPVLKEDRDIWGCNWGVCKSDLLAINGFDEDYETAGYGEDIDVTWRLRATGVRLYAIRQKAIVYHLFHTENYNQIALNKSKSIFDEKISAGNPVCKNGLSKF